MKRPTTLGIVEDHILIRDLISDYCKKSGYDVILLEADGACVMDAYQKTRPDILILDVMIPNISGIKIADLILSEYPSAKIVFITSYLEKAIVKQMLSLSIYGLIDKSENDLNSFIEAIDIISEGGKYFSNNILKNYDEIKSERIFRILSKREIELLFYFGQNMTNEEISKKLYLSNSTVQTHKKNIRKKLGERNLAKFAQDYGFWRQDLQLLNIKFENFYTEA